MYPPVRDDAYKVLRGHGVGEGHREVDIMRLRSVLFGQDEGFLMQDVLSIDIFDHYPE